MTISEFKSLGEREQIDVMASKGVQIAKIEHHKKQTYLYQVDSFYVEVIFITRKEVTQKVKIFDTTDSLAAYLKKIDINSLIK